MAALNNSPSYEVRITDQEDIPIHYVESSATRTEPRPEYLWHRNAIAGYGEHIRQGLKRKARIQISKELLRDLLKLDNDTEILNIMSDYTHDCIDVCIANDACPEVLEGAEIPVVDISIINGWDK